MAVASVPRTRSASTALEAAYPPALLVAMLVPGVLMLLGNLQHMAALAWYGAVGAGIAALALAVYGVSGASNVWLWASASSFGAATALDMAGLDSAGLLVALGLLTLGHSGALAPRGRGTAGASLTPSVQAAQPASRAEEPTFPRAA